MLSQIKKLLGQSTVYGVGLMGASITTLVLTPMFLHRLPRVEYGMNEMLNTFASMLYSIMLLGIASVLVKIYINDCETEQERRVLVSSMVFFTCVVGIAMWVTAYALSPLLSNLLLKNSAQGHLIKLAAAGSGVLLVQQMALLCLRSKQRPWLFATVSLTQLTISIACNFYFVYYRGLGVLGIQYAALIAASISVTVGLLMIRSDLGFVFSGRIVKQVLLLSYPLIPASIVPWVLNVSDRYFLKHYWGLDVTGLYAVGYKVGMLGIVILVNAFQLAWSPIFFANRKNEDTPRLCANALKYCVLVLTSSGLVVSVFASEILRLIGTSEYQSAAWMVPFVALSYVFYGAHFYAVPLFVGANKGKWLGTLMLCVAAANIILEAFLIPKYGAAGAIAATMGTFVIEASLSLGISSTFFPVPYCKWDYAKILMSAGIVYCVFSHVHGLSGSHIIWGNAILKMASIPCFAMLLFASRFFSSRELALMYSIPGRVSRRIYSAGKEAA